MKKPKSTKKPIQKKSTEATGASSQVPLIEGIPCSNGKGGGSMIFVGGLPGKPRKKQ